MYGKNYCILDFLIGGMRPQQRARGSDHRHLIGGDFLCFFHRDEVEKMNREAAGVCGGGGGGEGGGGGG